MHTGNFRYFQVSKLKDLECVQYGNNLETRTFVVNVLYKCTYCMTANLMFSKYTINFYGNGCKRILKHLRSNDCLVCLVTFCNMLRF